MIAVCVCFDEKVMRGVSGLAKARVVHETYVMLGDEIDCDEG